MERLSNNELLGSAGESETAPQAVVGVGTRANPATVEWLLALVAVAREATATSPEPGRKLWPFGRPRPGARELAVREALSTRAPLSVGEQIRAVDSTATEAARAPALLAPSAAEPAALESARTASAPPVPAGIMEPTSLSVDPPGAAGPTEAGGDGGTRQFADTPHPEEARRLEVMPHPEGAAHVELEDTGELPVVELTPEPMLVRRSERPWYLMNPRAPETDDAASTAAAARPVSDSLLLARIDAYISVGITRGG